MRHAALFLAIALTGAALDLLTKHLAFQHVPRGGEIVVIDGFFSLGHTTNPGIIFGKFPAGRTLWLIVSIAAIPAILAIFFSVRNPRWILTVTLGMILAGTLGNMYDRVFTAEHAVRDFIKFYYRTASGEERVWPLFNLADSYICVGVFLLSIEMLFFDEKKKKKAPAPPAPEPAPASAPSPGPDPAAP
ncbi:MAG TPA: signal peptidase II [Planctomycetota bacterium]|nr:signal peptidase II [Planctomycetota bacterium]